jgi:hypothetical protein
MKTRSKWNQTVHIQKDFDGDEVDTIKTQVTGITKSGWGHYNGYAYIDGGLAYRVYSRDLQEWFADIWAG